MSRVKDKGLVENFLKRDGRLNRWRYFKRSMFVAFVSFMILFCIIIADVNALGQLSDFGILLIKIFSALMQVPIFCLMVRRLQDMNKNETLACICITLDLSMTFFIQNDFLTTEPSSLENILNVVNGLIALYIFLCPGTRGRNKYGEDPLA